LTDFIDGCLAVIAGTMPYHSSGSRIAFPGSQWPRRRSSPAFLRWDLRPHVRRGPSQSHADRAL